MEREVTNAMALAEGRSQSCTVSPSGYCHDSEWLIGNETRTGDCSVMAAELCPWGYIVHNKRAAYSGTMFSYLVEFVKAGININCTPKQAP